MSQFSWETFDFEEYCKRKQGEADLKKSFETQASDKAAEIPPQPDSNEKVGRPNKPKFCAKLGGW